MKENSNPTKKINVSEIFGIETDMEVLAFEDYSERVPEIEKSYIR